MKIRNKSKGTRDSESTERNSSSEDASFCSFTEYVLADDHVITNDAAGGIYNCPAFSGMPHEFIHVDTDDRESLISTTILLQCKPNETEIQKGYCLSNNQAGFETSKLEALDPVGPDCDSKAGDKDIVGPNISNDDYNVKVERPPMKELHLPLSLKKEPGYEQYSSDINLEKLYTLLEHSIKAGDCIDGKDVLLLIGATGSGKTTSLLYLSGVKFEEVEDEYKPTSYPTDQLQEFEISSRAESCTRRIQAFDLQSNGLNVAICDTPGFGDTYGLEYEIANGIGLVTTLYRAKSVIPVIVLSKECTDSRFQPLKDTLETVHQMTGGNKRIDLSSFQFLFTKCDEKDCNRLKRKLEKLNEEIKNENHPMNALCSLVESMVRHLSIYCLHIDLSLMNQELILSTLLQSANVDNKSLFKGFLSYKASDALKRTFQSLVINIAADLRDQNYDLAEIYIDQLIRLSNAIGQHENTFLPRGFEIEKVTRVLLNHCNATAKRFCQLIPGATQEMQYTLLTLKREIVMFEKLLKLGSNPEKIKHKIQLLFEKIEKSIRVNEESFFEMNLQMTAWRLSQLKKIATSFEGMDSAFLLTISYRKSLDRTNYIIQQKLLQVKVDATRSLNSSVSNLDLLLQIIDFATDLQQWGVGITRIEGNTFIQQLDTLLRTLRNEFKRRKSDLVKAQVEFNTWLNARDEKLFSATKLIQLTQSRDYIVGVTSSKLKFEKIFGVTRNLLEQCIACFDRSFNLYILGMLSILETKWGQISSKNNSDFTVSYTHAKYVISKLNEIQAVCEHSRTWRIFDTSQIDRSWEKTVRFQESVKNFLNDANEEMLAIVNEYDDALVSAASILCRLQAGKENILDLLHEVCEARNWKKWSNFLFEDSTIYGKFTCSLRRVKNAFGFSDKHNELKNRTSKIIEVFQKNVQTVVVRFLALPSQEQFPIMVAKSILSNVEMLVFLLSLLQLPRDSDLRSRILSFNSHSELVKMVQKTNEYLKHLAGLHLVLCDNKQFNELYDLISLWKPKQESLIQLSSTACLPMASPETSLDSSLIFLRDTILLFPPIGDVIKDCFNAISFVTEDIKRISFFPVDDVATPHKRLLYFESIAGITSYGSVINRFREFAETANQELMFDAESCFLSKISEELTLLNGRLSNQMKSFPSDRSNFKNIHECLSNLSCVETAFEKSNPTIARAAADIVSKIDNQSRELLSNNCLFIPTDKTVLKDRLLLWKKAGYEIHRWSVFVNECISNFLKRALKQASCRSSFLFDLTKVLNNAEGEDKILAKHLLSEHAIFEGLINSSFNRSTERQNIFYVLDNVSNISKEDHQNLLDLYDVYESEYQRIIQQAFYQIGTKQNFSMEEIYTQISCEATELAKTRDMTYSMQVSVLTAKVFAYWSLTSNKDFFECDGPRDRQFLKCPHSAQVIAIWLMLNILHQEHVKLENTFVELKTGEGKSIVLGVTATILALLGLEVDCSCYSEYLSNRDYGDFCHMFQRFGVTDKIHYTNIRTLSNKLSEDYRSQAKLVLQGKDLAKVAYGDSKGPRILLVDEVDVFFGQDVFGEQRFMATTFSSSKINELFHSIWNDSNDGCITSEVLKQFPTESHRLVNLEIETLYSDARIVKDEISDNYVVHNGKIMEKYFDGLRTYASGTYCFRYLKEFERGNITKEQLEDNLRLSIAVGTTSFAEIPYEYEVVLGLTGTLRGVDDLEMKILKEKYFIQKYFYLPSVYGENRLKFAAGSEQDVMICESRAGFFLELKTEIERRRNHLIGKGKAKRAVLVFFRNKKTLLDFYDSSFIESIKEDTQVITEVSSQEEREGCFSKSTESGAITLMIRDFGRGTDFKCYDQEVLNGGGVHVIQAFFSLDLSEEIQIKGRCARQGADGSFSMILEINDLIEDFSISKDSIISMKARREIYTSLDQIRKKVCETEVTRRLKHSARAAEHHYWTLEFHESMRQGKKDHLVSFIEEINDLSHLPSFATKMSDHNVLKQMKINEHTKRWRDFVAEDKKSRIPAEDLFMVETNADDTKKKQVRDCVTSPDSTFYMMLGVNEDAPIEEIAKVFRELSKLFHPDKCSDPDAKEIFQKLNEAKEILCCESERSAYDSKLRSRNTD